MTISPSDVAAAVAPKLAERAASHDRDAAFPADDVADLREHGLLGLMVPERLGGLGAGFRDYVEVALVLGGASASTALLFNMHASVTGALAGLPDHLARSLGASDDFFEMRDDVLRRAGQGAMYGVAISEAGAGSRLSEIRTTYCHDGDGFRIVGDKVSCSGAGRLDGYLVAARSAGDPPVVSYFLVPGDAVEAQGEWDPLGMRGTASRGARLDTHVPGSALLGGVEGIALLLAYAMPQWLVASYAAVYAGLAASVVEEGAAYLRADGRATESSKVRLGRADAAAAAARLAVREAARLVDEEPGEPATNQAVYRAKLLAGDAVMDAAASVAEACGLGALRRGTPLERAFRDARFGALMPPRSDVAASYLGTVLLGLDPETDMVDRPW